MNTFDNITNQTMKTEDQAWDSLRRHAAEQLSPGFPDRVLRAARGAAQSAPSYVSQFFLGAATVGLCLLAVAFFYSRTASAEAQNIASWQEVSSDADDVASL